MSRIEEAWRRASGAAVHNWDGAPGVERLEESPEAVLYRFPLEAGPPGASAPATDRPHLMPPASPPSARRQLGPVHEAFERKLVVSGSASPIAVEQYRRLAGAVHDLQVEQGLRTLMVTSAVPGEGKTLTAANLALTLSESCERRVLLIDADLRRPFVHDLFRVPNTSGLSDALRSESRDLPVQQVSEFLSVLPAGQLDQPMALTSDRMRNILEECAAAFDWVLLDAAPVGFMPDAQLLARLTRAVLFVIGAHTTPHWLVSRAIGELGPECVVGTILNQVSDSDIPAAGFYLDHYSPEPSAR